MLSFYYILLSLCFYDILVVGDLIVCRFTDKIEVQMSNNKTISLVSPTVKFEYDNNIEQYTNRTTSSIRNTFFKAFIKQQPDQLYIKSVVKFTNIKELRAASDFESHGVIDERQYCSVTLLQDSSVRVGVPKGVEIEMRKTLLSSLQFQLCESTIPIDAEHVVQNMKYRGDSEIAREKLQDSVNAISDFVLSRLVYSLTNKHARIPVFNGTIDYPILGGKLNYTVFKGFFYNIVKIDRLMDTTLIENNNKTVAVNVAYRLQEINTNFQFKLSDRKYKGQIDVSISKIVFAAKMIFDYTECHTELEKLHILNVGELNYEISEGLAWYERIMKNEIDKVIYRLLMNHLSKVIDKMVTLKIENFQCGAQKRKAIESITKLAVILGEMAGNIAKKYINDL